MREILVEIWFSIRHNKLRTFLTGFSVAWGILMLIILLSSGNGLQNGMMSNFDYISKNSITLYSSYTSIPYGGYDKGRPIRLAEDDVKMLEGEFSNVEHITVMRHYSGGTLTHGDQFVSVSMSGVSPQYADIYKIEIVDGRFVNEQDVVWERKSIVINEQVRDVLFPDGSSIGRQVVNNNVVWTVVGVYKGFRFGNSNESYIPYNTGKVVYAGNDPWVMSIAFTVDGITDDAGMARFENDLIRTMAHKHSYSPDDKSAIYVRNSFNQFKQMNKVFRGLDIFIWVIGLGTLLAGIVGVSNIMLVTVKERTFEFGIRKALGAPPSSIIRLILLESVLITAFFGYVGLVLGVGVMEIVNYILQTSSAASQETFTMFQNPTLDLNAAIMATVVLVIAGLVAGYVPAKRAARLKTIDAMRYNK